MAARASPMAAQALALGRDDPIARQALADPEVRRCYFSADLNATPVRAALPAPWSSLATSSPQQHTVDKLWGGALSERFVRTALYGGGVSSCDCR